MNEEIKEIIESKFPASDVELVAKLLKIVNKDMSDSNKTTRIKEIEYLLNQKIK